MSPSPYRPLFILAAGMAFLALALHLSNALRGAAVDWAMVVLMAGLGTLMTLNAVGLRPGALRYALGGVAVVAVVGSAWVIFTH